MFAGIVADIGRVTGTKTSEDTFSIRLQADLLEGLILGESICVSGVCLTVVKQDEQGYWFDLATETRRCTTLGNLVEGSIVNLERSLQASQLVHGHFVQGHVDTMAKVVKRTEAENTVIFHFERPQVIADLIVPKGSISIDGVSLTVGEVNTATFSVYIIPHTLEVTTFHKLIVGDSVNLESDCLARYVRGIVQHHLELARCS
jgi:riboflavin synthase